MSKLAELESRVMVLEKLISSRRKSVADENRDEIIKLLARGLSYRAIEARTGVSFSTVGRINRESNNKERTK